jgi:hypothetical protein
MKILKYLFGIPGSILVLIAFFLPWVNANFAPTGISGRDFAIGYGATATGLATLLGEPASAALYQNDSWVWMILGSGVFALLAILFSFISLEKASIVTGTTLVVSGIVGVAFLYLRAGAFLVQTGSTSNVMLSARDLFQGFSPATGVGLAAGLGLYLLLAGLFLMIIGGIFSFAPTPAPVLDLEPAASLVFAAQPHANAAAILTGPTPLATSGPATLVASTFASQPVIPDNNDATNIFNAPIKEGSIKEGPIKERFANPQTIVDSKPPDSPSTEVFDLQNQTNIFAWLIVRESVGLQTGQSYTISTQVFTVGRAAESILHLTDSSVSTKHAEIRQQGSTFSVHDLGSSNGTFVFNRRRNDWKQVDQVQLKDGDQIKFGRSIFSFINVES